MNEHFSVGPVSKCDIKDCEEIAIDQQELDVAEKLWLCERHLISYEKYWEADVEARPQGN